MSMTSLGKLWSCPKRLTLPPDSLMVVFGVRVTVSAVALTVGAVGGNSDRHGGNVLGNGKPYLEGCSRDMLCVYILLQTQAMHAWASMGRRQEAGRMPSSIRRLA